MPKKFLYGYFGNIMPNNIDIPGHFLYQPFLIDEICSAIAKDDAYKVDLYSYIPIYSPVKYSNGWSYYPEPVQGILLDWENNCINTEGKDNFYINISMLLNRINKDYYDYLILKARFRNPSTHAKKLYDVKKFEAILDAAIKAEIPVLIVDSDLSLPDNFINLINSSPNIKIWSLGNLFEKYHHLSPEKVYSYTQLYGINVKNLQSIRNAYSNNASWFEKNKPDKSFLYYGNIASANYKAGQTKNYEVLEYLIKFVENENISEYSTLGGYLIGKVEDSRFFNSPYYKHINRYDRLDIARVCTESRISINISKDLYIKSDFTPARVTEAIIFGMLPLSYGGNTGYQNNKTLVFNNYTEFLECMHLYLLDTTTEDHAKFFLQLLDKNIATRQSEASNAAKP